jgi:N-glycosylase/DNA lyase
MREELTDLYRKRRNLIRKRLREFKRVAPEDYFYEMVYCLLTPQTNARHAEKAVELLRQKRFHQRSIDPLPFLHTGEYYIRFHITKAKRLQALKYDFNRVEQILADTSLSADERRTSLVSVVDGYGLKEATHFLRNIGKNDGLAILDRHILRNLQKYDVIKTVPSSLPPKRYYQIEKRFQLFAQKIQIPLDELDLLFWSMQTGVILK